MVVARVFARLLDDLLVGELARGVLDQALLVGQVEVHLSPLALAQASLGVFHGAVTRRSISSAIPSIGNALLRQRVAVAQRHRAVLDALVVDRQAERRADLVLAAVALADRAALVVLGLHRRAQRAVDLARELRLAVLA